jgi:DNA polymerase III subunit delta'
LKLLEEPQPKTIFILLSESTTQVLPTILSRTQVVRIPSYSIDVLTHYLETLGARREIAISLAARAEGSLQIAKQSFEEAGETAEYRELFIQLMRVCFKKEVNSMLDWVGIIGLKSREEQKMFVDYSLHMIRQSLLKNYTNEMLVRVSPEEAQFLANFARFITNNNCLEFMQLFTDSHYHLNRNAHGQLLFTNLCFQVMRFIHKA